MIECPYRPACEYKATSELDLEEHLVHMPTSAPEHQRDLPKRTPGMFVRQMVNT